jgi:predicted dehydrogenase
MGKLRIGVMGCASIALRAMIPAIKKCCHLHLVAVSSRTEKKARQSSDFFGCEAITGYEKMLERDDIDAVYMPLPTGLHEKWVTKTLEAGKHILVEKSFTDDFEAAIRMVNLARFKNLLIMENYLFPHHFQHSWVMDLISSGGIGKIHLLRATFGFPPLPEDDFRYKANLGGGALIDAGGYVVKAAQLFLGFDLKLLGASLFYDHELGVDIYGDALLKNHQGQVAQLSFGFNYYYQCCCEFLGTKGKLILEKAFTPAPGFKPIVRLEYQDFKKEIMLPSDNHYLNMCNFFVKTVKFPNEYSTHLETILNQVKLLDKIRKESNS